LSESNDTDNTENAKSEANKITQHFSIAIHLVINYRGDGELIHLQSHLLQLHK